MSYGVIYGPTGSFRLPTGRAKLAIADISSASAIIPGKTKDTFILKTTGLHLISLDMRLLSPTNIIPFVIELFNVTQNHLVQQRNSVVPGHPLAVDRHFGFDWVNENITDEYAFYITAQCGGFALLTQDLNFRAVVQMFGGSGIGGLGVPGTLAKWITNESIGESILSELGRVLSVAGCVRMVGPTNGVYLCFDDGQNVPQSTPNQGRIRYNANRQVLEISVNGNPWRDLTSGPQQGEVDALRKEVEALKREIESLRQNHPSDAV